MLKSITMTQAETEIYDNGGIQSEQLMRDLRARASQICESDDLVEIYTADGIVADTVDSES